MFSTSPTTLTGCSGSCLAHTRFSGCLEVGWWLCWNTHEPHMGGDVCSWAAPSHMPMVHAHQSTSSPPSSLCGLLSTQGLIHNPSAWWSRGVGNWLTLAPWALLLSTPCLTPRHHCSSSQEDKGACRNRWPLGALDTGHCPAGADQASVLGGA